MEQSVTWCTTSPLPCGNCYPAEVILCMPAVLTATGLGFIDAVLANATKISDTCGSCSMQYTFTYDTDDLSDPVTPLTNLNINGAICRNCMTRWVEGVVSIGLTGWHTDESGNFVQDANYPDGRIVYTAGDFGIFSNTVVGADNLGITIGGGGAADSARGANIIVSGNQLGGGIRILGGAISTGNLDFGIQNSSAKIRFINNNDLVMWAYSNNGQLRQDATSGGNIVFTKSSSFIEMQSGVNARTGTFTLNGATPVVVLNTSLGPTDMITIQRDTPAGTPGVWNLTARVDGTSFTVTGTALDTSGMRYTLTQIN